MALMVTIRIVQHPPKGESYAAKAYWGVCSYFNNNDGESCSGGAFRASRAQPRNKTQM
jgi:hypothetical protein